MGKRLTTAIIVLLIVDALLFLASALTLPMLLLNVFDDNFTSVEYDDVTYMPARGGANGYYHVTGLSQSSDCKNNIYVLNEINGAPVKVIYLVMNAFHTLGATFSPKTFLNRIYFPWCIEAYYIKEIDNVGMIISADVDIYRIDNIGCTRLVVPKIAYDKLSGKAGAEDCIPANVAYFFNYEGCPNEGYFFVDLIDKPGKLTRPPYNPSRAGYTFAGWYTEPECINEWNFDNVLDEIPNEFGLYAKWIEN